MSQWLVFVGFELKDEVEYEQAKCSNVLSARKSYKTANRLLITLPNGNGSEARIVRSILKPRQLKLSSR